MLSLKMKANLLKKFEIQYEVLVQTALSYVFLGSSEVN